MEEIREYIESGILELYVLGDVSAEERADIEEKAARFPEIRTEIAEIERWVELYAEVNAVDPPEQLRDRIMNGLVTNLADDRIFKSAPSRPSNEPDDTYLEETGSADNVIVLPPRKNDFYKYAFAACLTLLLISVYGLVNLYTRLQDSTSQLTAMRADKEKIANQVNLMDEELDMYRDPSVRIIKLQGTAKTPASMLALAWSGKSKKVMLDMHGMKLPKHDEKHQYQLWALVAGKPVDLGVFDMPQEADTSGIKEMKAIAAADTFAVTIEPMGGSVNPTLDQMVVAANTR